MEPNQEIITSLKNAIEHGDSLQNAMQIMINSGYAPQEVKESSKYIGQGVTPKFQPKPEEQLTMPGKPRKKSFFSKLNIFKKKSKPPQQEPVQQPQIQQPIQSTPQTQLPQQPTSKIPIQQPVPQQPKIQQPISQPQSNQPLAKQLQKIKPKKHSYFKEITLLAILIILVGTLIATIIYRDEILRFFSG